MNYRIFVAEATVWDATGTKRQNDDEDYEKFASVTFQLPAIKAKKIALNFTVYAT